MKEKINSPCVRNCCLNDEDICLGCGRSLEEVKGWLASSNQQKVAVIKKAAARKKAFKF